MLLGRMGKMPMPRGRRLAHTPLGLRMLTMQVNSTARHFVLYSAAS